MFKWLIISIYDGVWTLLFIGQIKLNTLTNDYQHSIINHEHERGRQMLKIEKKLLKNWIEIDYLYAYVREWNAYELYERKMILILKGRESVEKPIDKRLETVHIESGFPSYHIR